MESIHGVVYGLLVAWGVVTAILVVVLVYRSTLETREEDQIFLDAAGESMASEQRALWRGSKSSASRLRRWWWFQVCCWWQQRESGCGKSSRIFSSAAPPSSVSSEVLG